MSAVMTKTTKAKAAAASPLEAALAEALKLYRVICKPGKFGDDRDHKLTARAYLAEALAHPTVRKSAAELEALAPKLDATSAEWFPWTAAFRATCRRRIRATRVADGAMLAPAIGNWHTLMGEPSGASPGELPLLLIELTEWALRPAELLALEVQLAAREAPECFGAIDAPLAEHERARAERLAAYDAACAAIPAAASVADDLALHYLGREAWRLTFRWRGADTGVPFAPDGPAGARLVEWVAAQA